ncbi:DUF2062 domain-containing protein [Marixanthomonas spongiae]|uniref:DUF2062 domain-containing protein n=2 Tax=Marixanthomonas spongiae TaxID=2174845 RepID=A0A2U0HZQ7_9FLAO|nr:DUF2062 domain-containing protein [Marixanthomonas spongiae]
MQPKYLETTQKLKQYNCCVLIPTYNNYKTLKRVLDGVLEYTDAVVLVNDGSTDETLQILSRYPQIEQIHINKNQGKGYALKKGFKHAVSFGFDYAITLDSDGQHFPSDIPIFINALDTSKNKNLLLIGDRKMNESDVLAQSRKGNNVSSFWVRAVTDLELHDTQSGFRLYPIKYLKELSFFRNTKKFEFEVEVLVKAHWAGTLVKNVPIKVLYDLDERVSHFRPFMDIARITILIIWFLIVKYFYIRPRDFFRKVKQMGLRQFLREEVLGSNDSPEKKALSVALGLFIGLSPLWGFHTVIVIFLAIALKLNKVIAFAFSNISLPPFIPFVFLASLTTGYWVLGQKNEATLASVTDNFEVITSLKAYFVGSIVLSVGAALILGSLSYLCFYLFDTKRIQPDG